MVYQELEVARLPVEFGVGRVKFRESGFFFKKKRKKRKEKTPFSAKKYCPLATKLLSQCVMELGLFDHDKTSYFCHMSTQAEMLTPPDQMFSQLIYWPK